jgi:hypothetical protein
MEAAENLTLKTMADAAQLKALIDTKAQLKADLDATKKTISDCDRRIGLCA